MTLDNAKEFADIRFKQTTSEAVYILVNDSDYVVAVGRDELDFFKNKGYIIPIK